MTKEDKQLLLKDLSARLPYGVICNVVKNDNPFICNCKLNIFWLDKVTNVFYNIKPYLRPMSSMTKEERKEYNDIVKNTIDFYNCPKSEEICFFVTPIDWLNAHHFDYRGLIPMGLALEASKDMYK